MFFSAKSKKGALFAKLNPMLTSSLEDAPPLLYIFPRVRHATSNMKRCSIIIMVNTAHHNKSYFLR